MESLSDPSNGLRIVAARYTGAYFPPHHFLAVWLLEPPFILNYDVQSRPFPTWCLKPSYLLSYDIQSRLSQLDIHSYQFSLAFKVVVSAWHS